MRPKHFLFVTFLLVWALLGTSRSRAWSAEPKPSTPEKVRDEEKKRLFNTFYFSADKMPWILVMHADRTYDLTGPDGRKATGRLVASDKEIGLKAEGVSRHFSFKYDGTNVTLTSSKKDTPKAGDLLGEMPPVHGGTKAVYVSVQNWTKAGLPTSGAAPDAQTPATPKTEPEVELLKDIAGEFSFLDAQAREHKLRLVEGGKFEYGWIGGRPASGTFVYVNGELTLDSGFHRRHLAVASADGGLQISRRDADVLKLDDPLGEMPPQDRLPVVWKKVGASVPVAAPASAPPVAPATVKNEAPLTPVTAATPPATPPSAPAVAEAPPPKAIPKSEPAPVPVAQRPPATPAVAPEEKPVVAKPPAAEPVLPRAEEPPPAVARPPASAKSESPSAPEKVSVPAAPLNALADWAGPYSYRPNPLVTETWILQADGKFEYRNSNEAKVAGTATLEGENLRLQAGEVVRNFVVTREPDGSLTLKRSPEDNPKIANDLQAMSPSVQKSARYEKTK